MSPSKSQTMLGVFFIEMLISSVLLGIIIFAIWSNAVSVPTVAASQPSSAPDSQADETATPANHEQNTPTITTPTEADHPIFALPPSATPENTPTFVSDEQFLASGPLTVPQQMLLNIASLKYVAPTTQEAIRIAQEINFIGNDGHPSNMCGPLSIAILRDAGILNPDTNLSKFWLLDPKQNSTRKLLASTFPEERFENFKFTTPLNQFDWNSFPLQPGDFLYIYAGIGGNFEHMLVVDRVDYQLRAYAVTNHATPDGFVITEVLLYDPEDKNIGIFHTWTERHYAMLGSTGFGGFELWRLRSP
jgi:hypothetical protein